MPRVWKYFLLNLAGPVGFATYIVLMSSVAYHAELYYNGYGIIVVGVFFVFPVFTYLVYDMWRDAKEKVEQENREMMRRIRGE